MLWVYCICLGSLNHLDTPLLAPPIGLPLISGYVASVKQWLLLYPGLKAVFYSIMSAFCFYSYSHNNEPPGPSLCPAQVLICGDCSDSKATVIQLARGMGFHPVDLGGLAASRDIEDAPLHLFPSWGGPILATFLIFLFFYCYNFLKGVLLPFLQHGKNNFYQLPLEMVNETLPAVALVTLALVYLPGTEEMHHMHLIWGHVKAIEQNGKRTSQSSLAGCSAQNNEEQPLDCVLIFRLCVSIKE